MTKVKSQPAKTIGKEDKSLGAISMVGAARKEKNFQIKLDRMQVAVATGDVQISRATMLADKEMANLRKTHSTLEGMKLKSVADFSALKAIYDESLKGITAEGLASEYAVKANAEKLKAFGTVNPAQIAVIDRYYAIKARKEWNVIAQVKRILDFASGKVPQTAVVTAHEAVLAN